MTIITVKADASSALKALNELASSQIPFATSLALNRTAQFVRTTMVGQMDSIFDAPTPFTKNALYIKASTKTNLVAYVQVKDKQRKYLTPEIEGGPRGQKGFESLLIRSGLMQSGWFAVPASGQKLDQYGNVPPGTVTKILSQLQSARDSLTNESAAKRTKRNRKLPQGRYFCIRVGDTSHLKPGIYERKSMTAHGGIVPIFIFTAKAPKYSKRWDFYGIAQRLAEDQYPIEFEKAISVAIATAR